MSNCLMNQGVDAATPAHLLRYAFRVPAVRNLQHRHARETNRDEHLVVMADLFAMLADRSRLRILMQLAERKVPLAREHFRSRNDPISW